VSSAGVGDTRLLAGSGRSLQKGLDNTKVIASGACLTISEARRTIWAYWNEEGGNEAGIDVLSEHTQTACSGAWSVLGSESLTRRSTPFLSHPFGSPSDSSSSHVCSM
jgi:hypothetical protein